MVFVKGDPAINRKGRPLGLRDFNTDFNEVLQDIAKEEGITPSEARKNLLKTAYRSSKSGSFNFYQDIAHRSYGVPTKSVDITTNGKNINNYAELNNDQLADIAAGLGAEDNDEGENESATGGAEEGDTGASA